MFEFERKSVPSTPYDPELDYLIPQLAELQNCDLTNTDQTLTLALAEIYRQYPGLVNHDTHQDITDRIRKAPPGGSAADTLFAIAADIPEITLRYSDSTSQEIISPASPKDTTPNPNDLLNQLDVIKNLLDEAQKDRALRAGIARGQEAALNTLALIQKKLKTLQASITTSETTKDRKPQPIKPIVPENNHPSTVMPNEKRFLYVMGVCLYINERRQNHQPPDYNVLQMYLSKAFPYNPLSPRDTVNIINKLFIEFSASSPPSLEPLLQQLSQVAEYTQEIVRNQPPVNAATSQNSEPANIDQPKPDRQPPPSTAVPGGRGYGYPGGPAAPTIQQLKAGFLTNLSKQNN